VAVNLVIGAFLLIVEALVMGLKGQKR